MNPKRIFLMITAALSLLGCASNGQKTSTPAAASTNAPSKFSGWSDTQLEIRAAQDRRDLARSNSYGVGATNTSLYGQMAIQDKQQELEDVKAEMMRRDPSGGMLVRSYSMY